MKILVDMNLSPEWVQVFQKYGWTAVHWSTVGKADAEDAVLMRWAETNGHLVFTHDLDFGTLLALTKRKNPSVLQVRSQDVSPPYLEKHVVLALRQFEPALAKGAIVVVEEDKTRVRLLPFQSTEFPTDE